MLCLVIPVNPGQLYKDGIKIPKLKLQSNNHFSLNSTAREWVEQRIIQRKVVGTPK